MGDGEMGRHQRKSKGAVLQADARGTQPARIRAGAISPRFGRDRADHREHVMWLGEIWRRLQVMARRQEFEAGLDEEIRLHLELRAEQEADPYVARRRFGNTTQLKEPAPRMYAPVAQKTWTPMQTMQVAIRTKQDPALAAGYAREAIRAVDPQLPVADV